MIQKVCIKYIQKKIKLKIKLLYFRIKKDIIISQNIIYYLKKKRKRIRKIKILSEWITG